ncbi:hypothetical protein [Streptomyces sp. NPDC003077]|uniref:hypothetical protein n=1 Tax=Streptomyces sp. NPDC003077 TaxID=3154443 RepID=UPI0033B73639
MAFRIADGGGCPAPVRAGHGAGWSAGPFGNTAVPFGITAVPFGVTAGPFGITAVPFGVTAGPFGIAAGPFGIARHRRRELLPPCGPETRGPVSGP